MTAELAIAGFAGLVVGAVLVGLARVVRTRRFHALENVVQSLAPDLTTEAPAPAGRPVSGTAPADETPAPARPVRTKTVASSSARVVTMATDRLVRHPRPPLPRGQDCPRLPDDRLQIRSEPLSAEHSRAEQRAILERSLTNLRQAEPAYRELLAAEPLPTDPDPDDGLRPLPGGTEQVTLDGMSVGFPRARLDRLWASLVEHGHIVLIVPSLSMAAKDQLRRLGAQAEAELGRPVSISVRQTDDRPEPGRPVVRNRIASNPRESLPESPKPMPSRPPLSDSETAPRLPAARFNNWLEVMHGENALSAQRRILHLTLVDPRRAELDYQDLIAAEPGADPASKTGTPGAVNRITTDGMFTGFSDAKLDQFWADFTEQRALVLTVPSMSAASRDQLLRLGAQAELELGCSVAVSVRETA